MKIKNSEGSILEQFFKTMAHDDFYNELKSKVGEGAHPDKEILQKFALSELNEQDSIKYNSHILFCQSCSDFVDQVMIEDIAKKQKIADEDQTKTLKDLVSHFIKKFYPNELPKFDVVWEILKDSHIDEMFGDDALVGVMAISGESADSQVNLPRIVLCIANAVKGISVEKENINLILKNIDINANTLNITPAVTQKLKEYIEDSI